MKKIYFKIIVVVIFFLVSSFFYLQQQKVQNTKEELPSSIFSQEDIKILQEEEQLSEEKIEEQVEKTVFVYVCGAVNSPGVYELCVNDRVCKAIELAGGFTEEAAKDYHNLARVVEDGERIYILTIEEWDALSLEEQQSGEEANQSTTKEQALVNLNTATVEELTTLSGIGETRAQSIIEYRTKIGKFTTTEELMNISGIGEAMFEKIKDKIIVE